MSSSLGALLAFYMLSQGRQLLTRLCQNRNGKSLIQTSSPIPQSSYTAALDAGTSTPSILTPSTVRYWSDFSRVFFHPRSIVQINDYELTSTILPFEKWASGEDLFRSLDGQGGGDSGEGLMDRDVRRWAEECDHLQGVQIWTGADDAWGGFASRYVEALRDEMGKTEIWTWGLEEEKGRGSRVNTAIEKCDAEQWADDDDRISSFFEPSTPPSPCAKYRRRLPCTSHSRYLRHRYRNTLNLTEIRNGILRRFFRWR